MADSTPRQSTAVRPTPNGESQGDRLGPFSRLVDALPDGVIVVGDAAIVFANQAAARLLGVSDPLSLCGRNFLEFIPPDLRDRIAMSHQRLRAGEPDLRSESRFLRADGSHVRVEVTSMPIPFEGGVAIQTIARAVDRDDASKLPKADDDERYRTIVENMTDVVYAVDQSGTVTYISPSCQRVMGYRPEDVVGRAFATFLVREDLPVVQQSFDDARFMRHVGPVEFRVIDAAGSIRHVRSAVSASIGVQDRLIVSGVLTDVTERWRAEEEARRERQLLERVAETSPIGIVVLAPDGRVLSANSRAQVILGVPGDLIVGRSYNAPEWKVNGVDERAFLDGELPVARVMATHRPVYGVEHAVEWPSGRRVLVSVNAAPVLDEAGEITAIVASVEDITDRRNAEAELRRSEQRFMVAFRSSPAPMAIMRVRDGVVIDANDAMLDMLGHPHEEAIGRTVLDLDVWPDRAMFTHIHERLTAEGRIREEALVVRARDGRSLSIRYSGELVDLGGEPCILSAFMDVTDREAAANALRESERRLRQLIDSAPFGAHVYELRPDDRLVFVGANEAANRILGVDCGQFVNMTIEQAFPPLADTPFPDAYRRVARDGTPFHEEHISYDAGGIEGAFDVYGLHLAPGRMAAFFLDITERKRAEEARRLLAERLRALVEGIPLPIVGLDKHRTVIVWNAGAERVFGWKADEIVGKPYPIVPAELEATAQEDFRRALAGEPMAGLETRRIRRDGSPVDVRVWSAAWPREGGEPQGIFAILEDVTKEKRDAAALSRSAQEIQELYNRAPVGYHSLDSNAVFVRINDTELAWLGYARADIVGRRFTDLLDADGARAYEKDFERLKTQGMLRDLDYQLIRHDGSRLPVLLSSTAIRDEAGGFAGANSTMWDATEQRAAQAEREALEALLRQAQKMEAVGKLAGGVAHDFNNLLTAILGYAELLGSTFTPGDPRLDDVDQIRGASDNAAALIRQLLAFSRRQVLQPVVMDLGACVRRMERMLRRLLGEDIVLETRIASKLDSVLADESQMVQVVLNLAVNARDAMPDGGRLVIEVDNDVLDQAFADSHPSIVPGRHVRMTVLDSGIGMDEATRLHLFEPFFTTKALGKGTGLGLATVYGVVKQSGGSVWVDSTPGAGTRFTVYLPSRDREPEATDRVPSAAATAGVAATILIVEDAPAVRAYVDTVLARCGHRVLIAEDGPSALELIGAHEGRIDVLLTDVVMPTMSGRELAQRVRTLIPDIRVVFMSGYATTLLSDEALAEHHAVLLSKPFTPDQIKRTIQDVLRRSTS